MDFGERLRAARRSAGLTQQQVAKSIGITNSTYCGYETGKRQPDVAKIKSLCRIIHVSADDLLGTEFGLDKTKAPSLPDEALKVAKGYDGLDPHGKCAVRVILTEEQKRMDEEAQMAEAAPSNVIPFPIPKKKTSHQGVITIEVFEEPSAAGEGNYVSSAPASHMEQYPEEVIHRQTDYGVVISGQSMEPKYPDKAVVFVRSTQLVEPGEVGIFLLDGQTYIKQLQVDRETGAISLHSLNPEYADIDIPPYADLRVQGKVLGGYDPSTSKPIWK